VNAAATVSALLGGTLTDQARRLNLPRTQWSRYVHGSVVPLLSAPSEWDEALGSEGKGLRMTLDASGWAAELVQR
jgi:hypothetical protein